MRKKQIQTISPFIEGGKKYAKPVKYLLLESRKDKKTVSETEIYFYIEGKRFKFSSKNHQIDTLNLSFLKNIKKTSASKLISEELQFHNEMIEKDGYWKNMFKTRPPIPITKNHIYFQVFILEELEGKLLKYQVDWEKSHSY